MKPKAGQWWVAERATAGDTAEAIAVRIEHILPNGDIVVETYPGKFFVWKDANAWHHEPRCTGWNWVVPEQPQPAEDPDEWVILDPVKYTGHVLRKNIDFTNTRTGWEPISIWGGDTIGGVMNDYKGERVLFRCRRRDLPKVEPVEQWPKYYKPSQPRKTGYGKYVAYYKCSEPEKGETVHTDGTSFGFTVRAPGLDWTEITEEQAMSLLDKPTEPESKPQPQKKRVRLWTCDTDGVVVAEDNCPAPGWTEIHHDSEGFYVEGGRS